MKRVRNDDDTEAEAEAERGDRLVILLGPRLPLPMAEKALLRGESGLLLLLLPGLDRALGPTNAKIAEGSSTADPVPDPDPVTAARTRIVVWGEQLSLLLPGSKT